MGTCGQNGLAHRAAGMLIVGFGVLLAAAMLTSEASAATIKVSKRCYVDRGGRRATMTMTGRGFFPGDGVLITSSDGSVDTMATAGRDGTISAVTPAPAPRFRRPGLKRVTVMARDFTVSGTVITARTRVTVAPLAVATLPLHARLTQTVVWSFSGFTPGAMIFAHYLVHHRQVASARFGRAEGRCGVLKVRASLFPSGHRRFKRYGLQVDDSARYVRYTSPRIVTRLGRRVI
jgi:hypothetical protein